MWWISKQREAVGADRCRCGLTGSVDKSRILYAKIEMQYVAGNRAEFFTGKEVFT